MTLSLRQALSPSSQLLLFGGLLLAGMSLGGVMSVVLGKWIFGYSADGLQALLRNPTADKAHVLLLLNSISQICTFFIPAVVFRYQFGDRNILPLQRISLFYLLIPTVWILCASPIIDWIGEINHYLIPQGSWLEKVALPAEERASGLIQLFLSDDSGIPGIAIFLAIALVPAVCEEFAFRGALQPLLGRAFRNPHLAIWVTAVLFSAIHLQLYGFLPRVLLGAMLGYLAFWSGSLWPALAAHFINNATGIVLYSYTGSAESVGFPVWIPLLLCFGFGILTALLIRKARESTQ